MATPGTLPSRRALLHGVRSRGLRPGLRYLGPLGLPLRERPTSPPAYTARLALTWAVQTGLPRSALLPARACCSPYPAGTRRALRTRRVGRGLSRDVSGSAPGLFLEAAGFTSCCGPRACSPLGSSCWLAGFRHPARPPGSRPVGWGLLPGAPALAGAGLSPAGEARQEAAAPSNGRESCPASSRRTTHPAYRPGRLTPVHWSIAGAVPAHAGPVPAPPFKPCVRISRTRLNDGRRGAACTG